MADEPCSHFRPATIAYDEPDDATQFGLCADCRRRITRFYVDGDFDRRGYWSRWRLENILLVEDDFGG